METIGTLKSANVPFIVVTVLVIKTLLGGVQPTLKLILELKKERLIKCQLQM